MDSNIIDNETKKAISDLSRLARQSIKITDPNHLRAMSVMGTLGGRARSNAKTEAARRNIMKRWKNHKPKVPQPSKLTDQQKEEIRAMMARWYKKLNKTGVSNG